MDWVDALSMPLCVGTIVTFVTTGAMLSIQWMHIAHVRGWPRVLGTVVDYERRWDESYQRDELFPVVDCMHQGRRHRATIESGFMKVNDAPSLKLGDTAWVYLDPKNAEHANMLVPWMWTLLLGPLIGALCAAILLVTTMLGCRTS